MRIVDLNRRWMFLLFALSTTALFTVQSLQADLVSAQAATITQRSITMSDNMPGATAEYIIHMVAPAAPMLGSIMVEFCENSPLRVEPCDPPNGFTLAGATLVSQAGEGNFTIHPSSTANVLVLSRPPVGSTGIETSFDLQGVVNAADPGSQYARISTYASDDGTGPMTDNGSLAYALLLPLGLTTEVPPYLDFCVGVTIATIDCTTAIGDYLPLGAFNTGAPTDGQTQMGVATNAANGYSIFVNGQTLTSGNNVIAALSSPTPSRPGDNQFGINLRSNLVGGIDPVGPGSGSPTGSYNIPDRFVFRSGDAVASNNGVEAYRKFTVTYLVNISRDQPAGIYSGTYEYVAIGNF